ncbi:formylglycine-generating enzyme family protein [Phenylobacterium sp. J367]|uniref:formylglycine-generating enzyme family protein n=1 Tax=Phenylobacterium sp. J367 TaxID=2898435 RepID=UPI002150BB70|nr:formylglycine-generating enzyme family protein [Phenylobacterium sp. J367]MCR5879803.1 formylglycine-generating enzyme family protein [Phenylobacterium sp. J367]
MGAVLAFPEPRGAAAVRRGMVWVEGGAFGMGADRRRSGGRPGQQVSVAGFWIDLHPVTNREYARFVDETGWLTFAEIADDHLPPALMLPPQIGVAGSFVFGGPEGQPVDGWRYVPGASWRSPEGTGSTLAGLWDHPVVHVAWLDVQAYALWVGKDLPTEAEWEFAAHGGLDGAELAWGDGLGPCGRARANTWQDQLPRARPTTGRDGRTTPVGVYPANGYGLRDMIGNVWEWTKDWWPDAGRRNSRALTRCDPELADAGIPRKVLKGGSHLCGPDHCRCCRPAARRAHPIDISTSHVGFRCVVRQPPKGD